MSRLPASTTPVSMIATMDVDASLVGQLNHSSQKLPSFNSYTPPAQPSHSTTIPRDTTQSNQTDDEQSGVKHGHEAGTNRSSQTDDKQSGVKHGHEAGTSRNSQTDDEQSEVRNGNEAVENKNGQTDDEQSGITRGHEAGANKPVSHCTVIEQQGDLLDFRHSIAHCISADFKLGAGLAKQKKRSFRVISRQKRSTSNKYRTPSTWVMIIFFHLVVKPCYFHKPTYRSLRKTLLALRDQMNIYQIDKLGIPHLSCHHQNSARTHHIR